MKIHPDQTIGHIASEMEEAIPYFEKLKIDYTLEGDKTLRRACDDAGISTEEVLAALERIGDDPALESHWDQRTTAELVFHILRRHHDYTRAQIEKLMGLLREAVLIHGFKYPQLIILKNLFHEMEGEIIGHMAREEEMLFPYLVRREAAETDHQTIPNPFTESPFFRQPVRILQWEHKMTGEEWVQIRMLTNEYRLEEGADAVLKSLFAALRELEEDLHKHVHLENNILFRRAIEKNWIQ